MNIKEQLIKEIEQAPDYLIQEVLDFLLITKNKSQKTNNNSFMENKLQEMAEDPEILAEIKNINNEFSVTEIDGFL